MHRGMGSVSAVPLLPWQSAGMVTLAGDLAPVHHMYSVEIKLQTSQESLRPLCDPGITLIRRLRTAATGVTTDIWEAGALTGK